MIERPCLRQALALACALLCTLALLPGLARAEATGTEPAYASLEELAGKRFAYVNGSVYNQAVAKQVDGTSEDFYPSLAECVAAVESGKADAAVQLSYCCQLAVNRRPGTVTLLAEPVAEVSEGFFFPKGSALTAQFNDLIARFSEDGTLTELEQKWVAADESGKTLPDQDWDAPNGTLKFVTSGVIEPFSYVGEGGAPKGYDVELALLIARELGYHLEVSTLPMDSIFAAVDSGKADFGGTLTQTPERASVCDFSDTVMPTTISVIVKSQDGGAEGSTDLEIGSLDELDGKRLGILNSTVNDQLIEKSLDGTYDFSYFNSIADMVAALKSGKIDGFVTDEPVAALAAQRNDGIELIPEPVVEDGYGFIFPKGSELTNRFSEVIGRMEADGTLGALKKKWTGADDSAKTLPEQDWEASHGTLKMATGCQGEPMTYMQAGQPTGYDIEVALLICKELGYHLEVQSMEFSALITTVQTGKVDFAGSAISITDERKESVDFSIPNYHGSVAVAVRTSGTGTEGDFLGGLADSFRKTFLEEDRWQLILSGLGVTAIISVCAGVLGMFVGYGTVLARRSGIRWLVKLVSAYQALMGGLPLVVVLMVLYYVVFGSVDIPGTVVAIIAFTLSFGSTAGTTMWTAVDGIDTIQEETGLALGYTSNEVFRKIIFPQARQQFTPQLMGQFVSLLKDTAVVGYIAVQDLTRASDLIRARTMDAFFPLLSTALIYFIACRLLAWALGRVAAKLDATNRPRAIEGVSES